MLVPQSTNYEGNGYNLLRKYLWDCLEVMIGRWYPRQPISSHTQTSQENAAPNVFTCFPCVVIRMDTLKSGWTPYVYLTTLCSLERTIYANL